MKHHSPYGSEEHRGSEEAYSAAVSRDEIHAGVSASDKGARTDTFAYMDSVSMLASTRYRSTQELIDAILELLVEQLDVRTSFLTRITGDDGCYEVLAAHNLPGGVGVPPNASLELRQTF